MQTSNANAISKLTPLLTSLLTDWLNIDLETLYLAVDASDSEQFQKPRPGSATPRDLNVPTGARFLVQQRLVQQFFQTYEVALSAHGGVRHRSILTHVEAHLPAARQLLKLDLENAYAMIKRSQVERAWRTMLKRGGVTLVRFSAPQRQQLSHCLALLSCDKTGLSLGAPTSAPLFNMVLKPLDRALERITVDQLGPRGRYTRYLDDLVFSTTTAIPRDFVKAIQRQLTVHDFGRLNLRKTAHQQRELGHTLEISGITHNGRHCELTRSRLKSIENQLSALIKRRNSGWYRKFCGLIQYAEMVYGSRNLPFNLRQLKSQGQSMAG